MEYLDIRSQSELIHFLESQSGAEPIGFDTEFVSEDTYENELCLVQVATQNQLAVIDPFTVGDLNVFWEFLSNHQAPVIVHAGREEYRFCLRNSHKIIDNWFDIQIAAGMIGLEYPAAYSTLVQKLLSEKIPKGETRTDWRLRPLSKHQMHYALQDVVHLEKIHKKLMTKLEDMGRLDWYRSEIREFQMNLVHRETTANWERLSGVATLSSQGLSIARELWQWRESVAKTKNRPPRRILRDDLVVELARRGTSDPRRIRAVRGMERSNLKNYLGEIGDCIHDALEIPKNEWPKQIRKKSSPPVNLLSQFLNTALAAICRDAKIAPSIVGTSQDVRNWIEHRMRGKSHQNEEDLPSLSKGWRAEIVGKKLDKLLQGKAGICVGDSKSDMPLRFVPIKP